MKKIILLIFLTEYLGISFLLAQKKPLEFKQIVHFSPLIYSFQSRDTVFAVSANGQLITILLQEGNKLIKQKSKKIKLDAIREAGWDGKHLYLSSPKGLFKYSLSQEKIKKIAGTPLSINSLMDHAVVALYQNSILYFNKGITQSYTFQGAPLFYCEVLSDSLIIVAGMEKIYLINPFNNQLPVQLPKKRLSFSNRLKQKIRFDKNNGVEYFFSHFASKIKEYLMFAIGSLNDKTLMGLLNLKTISLIDTFWVRGELLNISHMKDRFLLTTGLAVAPNRFISVNYQYNFSTFVLDSFTTELTLDLFPLNDEYYLCNMGGGGVRIFKKNYPHHFYQMNLPFINYIGKFYFKLNSKYFNGDWFVFLASTNTLKSEHRVYQILFVNNQISECLKDMLKRVNLAKQMNNFRYCDEGLLEIETAMQYATFFARDSLEKYYDLRESLYKKYQIKKIVTSHIRRAAKYVIFIALTLLIILFYRKQKHQADLLKSIPSAETLHFLLGSAFFHKLVTILLGINQTLAANDYQKLKKLQNNVRDVKDFLAQKKINFEFKQSPQNWYRFYKQLKRYLFLLDWAINYYLRLQKIGILRKYFLRLIKHIESTLFQIREEFKTMVEQSKLDVIAHALLPAFNEVQQKYILKKIVFKNKIEGEFPFRYFPDEILKFRSVFEAILENAVHACLEKKGENHKIISVTAVSGIKKLKIKIEDNGLGMPDNVIKKIFSPGFSNRRDNRGHGYGLTGVKEFIEKYGMLEVKSEVDKGTSFIISLKLEKLI